jgi:hypothetical protein
MHALGNEAQVVSPQHNRARHLGRDDDALENAAADAHVARPRALLVNVRALRGRTRRGQGNGQRWKKRSRDGRRQVPTAPVADSRAVCSHRHQAAEPAARAASHSRERARAQGLAPLRTLIASAGVLMPRPTSRVHRGAAPREPPDLAFSLAALA